MRDTENDFSATLPAAWLLTEPPGDLCGSPAAPAIGSAAAAASLRAAVPVQRRRLRTHARGHAMGGMLALLRQWGWRPLRSR